MAEIFHTVMKTGIIIPLIPPRIKFRPILVCSSYSNQFWPKYICQLDFGLKKKKKSLLLLLGFRPFFFLFSFFSSCYFLLLLVGFKPIFFFLFLWWVSILPISLLFFICMLYNLNLLPLYSPRLPPLCVVFFFFFFFDNHCM